MTENPYEKQNRYKKAVLVVDVIEKKYSSHEISVLTDDDKAMIEKLANVRKLSEESWEMVRYLLEKRESDPLVK